VILTLSDGETLEVAPDAVPEECLPAVGERIPAPLLAQLRRAAERKLIARRLFQLLDRQLYPLATLRRKLHEDGYAPDNVSAVLAEFAANGLHSDRHFAIAYCRDTLRRRPVGRRYLQAQLRQRRVPAAVAEAVIAEILPAEREAELALGASRRRWARLDGAMESAARAKVFRFLVSRGFPRSVARRAAEQGKPQRED
jgi:SOS response regulatory protein OraA/RecX